MPADALDALRRDLRKSHLAAFERRPLAARLEEAALTELKEEFLSDRNVAVLGAFT